ncbi:DNA replication/repair protein RecF [uncultured Peptoniphilus sp.]|uniref:DNA replication/repair protein RecF n=1 Tax=uncultured Peptoniphilus sp. TaxID=254354 RepID=UPI00280421DE|nr:DNA replication/repair protein RecF [uncultured Peptoniphilus sp.]
MKLKFIRLYNFRNYLNFEISPHENINIFYGKNASGKTNLLEAIYMSIKGQTFKNAGDSELINFNNNETSIYSLYENLSYFDEYRIEISRETFKKYYVNDERKNSKEYRKNKYLVFFSPDHLNIIKNSPYDRRKFLNDSISNFDFSYEYYLGIYRKILMERNKLLKISKNLALLEIYDRELAKNGAKIVISRLKAIKKLNEYALIHYKNLTKGELLKTTYLSTVPLTNDEEELRKNLYSYLKENQKKDLEKKFTCIGPHRDDIEFKIDGKNVKNFGSQGEQRSVVLALKLAECDLISSLSRNRPILLLDDVFSEIDNERSVYLLNSIKNRQTFITTTNIKTYFKNSNAKYFDIENLIENRR